MTNKTFNLKVELHIIGHVLNGHLSHDVNEENRCINSIELNEGEPP